MRVAAAVTAMLLLGACSGAGTVATSTADPTVAGPSQVPTVTMGEDGCEYSGPARLAAGEVALELVNGGTGPFDADLWAMNAGHSYEELAAHIAEEQRRLDAGEPGVGHPPFAELVAEATVTAQRGTLTSRLAPGTYGVACIRSESGVLVQILAAGPVTVGE